MLGTNRSDAAIFEAFARHATKSVEGARDLLTMMTRLEGGAEAPYSAAAAGTEVEAAITELAAKIKAAETAGDDITRDTVKRLRETWLTPLDRDDIHQLITRMDDVLDYVEAAAERVVLFGVRVAPSEARELASTIVEACTRLLRAVELLRTLAKAPEILALCAEVTQLEKAADATYRRALAEIYKPGNEPLMVMKWRDIFESLESAVDACEDVANVVEGVVLEYA